MKSEKRTRIILPCMAVFLCSLSLSQNKPQQPVNPVEEDLIQEHVETLEETLFVTKAIFKNGLKVLINENRAHPVVSIQVFVKAGIFDEPADAPGLASLLTAMVYRATPDKSVGTSWQNTRLLGGFLESSTEFAHSRFEIAAPARQWRRALQLQSAALLNSIYDPDVVKMEARLLRDEAREYLDNPSLFAEESLLGLGFGSFRMGKWSTILKNDSGVVPYEKMISFHKRMYVPGRMMVVVSGDVNAVEVLNEVARLYGDTPAKVRRGRSIPVEVFQQGFRYRRIEGNVPISRLLFGFHTPAVDSPDYPALEVLNAVLGLGNGSILTARLRDQKKLILGAETALSSHPEFGYLTVHIKAAPEDIDRCEIAVFTELELLKRKGPDAAEMERAWAQLERVYRKRVDTVSGRARLLAQFESWGDWQRIDRHVADLRNVKASDIKRVAKKYLRMENCSLLEYVPSTVDQKYRTVDTIHTTLEGLLQPAADQEQGLREKETVLALDMPEKSDNYKFSWIQYPFEIASVLRGPEIFIREDHTTPLIHVGMFFPGGRLAETDQNSGITDLMVRMMLQSAEERSEYRFYRQLEMYGGQLQPVVADDYFGFYFSIISKNFHPGFKLLMDALKSPVLESETVERQKALLSADRIQLRDWRESVDSAIRRKLFHDFPYSRDLYGTAASIPEITVESLEDWYGLYVKNRKPVVVIIGDSEGTSLAAYFVQHFSGSRFQDTELAEDFVDPVEKSVAIERKWDKSLSLVSMGFQAPPEGDADRYATEVIQSYLGKSGKMYHEIRQRRGISSNIKLSYEPRLRGGSFIAYAVVIPGSEEVALDALGREFQHAVTGPYAYREYRSAVNMATGNFQLRQQTPILQITDVTRRILAEEGIEGYRSFRAKLQSVTEEDLQNAAERIFKTDRAVTLRTYSNMPLNHDASTVD